MKKKKVLFVTTRSPFSNIFSGDRERAKLIIEELSKKNKLDILYSDNFKGLEGKSKKKIFFKRNFLEIIKRTFVCLITLKPLQLGYFYSESVNNYIKKNHSKYQTIIFHLIRSAQYLPDEFKGRKILEMTDLISKNYKQIIKSFSIFHPLFYIYNLEKYFVRRYENLCLNKFNKIVLASTNDLKNTKIKKIKNFVEIPNTVNINKNIYKFKKSNHKILFIGNINYLPNKEACKNFAKTILPKLNIIFSNTEFHIIGEIKTSDKIFFNSIKKTYSHGPIKNMDPMIKNSICGICNLDIATGTQMKILTYMSYGLPCVSSDLSFKNTFFKRNKEILVYKNSDDFLKIIRKLKNNKIFSNQISRSSYQTLKKKYSKSRILSSYNKII
tara:strand:+ start:3919 stop:5070 length:1152 start_codon:yes stop_codon:yes gene_type:complete